MAKRAVGQEPREMMGKRVHRGDTDKALHHTITTAAAIANWHAQILKGESGVR